MIRGFDGCAGSESLVWTRAPSGSQSADTVPNLMSASVLIAGLALAVSLMSFALNLWVGHRAAVRSRKPVLVFVDEPDRGWTLRNIGNGPALNVIVAQRKDGQWFNPVRVRPMAKEQAETLEWLGRVNDTGLGVVYVDSEGLYYTSTVGAEILRTYEGARLPGWTEGEIRRYWEVGQAEAIAERWGAMPSDFRA